MAFRYANSTEGVSWSQVAEIIAAVGWSQRDPEDLRLAFECSSFVRVVYDGDRIVGFGRTMDDSRFYGMIVDLVIEPAYQGKGVGSCILRELREDMNGYLFVTLTAAPDNDGFYLKEGWQRQSSAFIWPRCEKQAKDHATPSIMIQEPISLTGQLVHLEPLSESHVPDLTMAGQGEAIWRYMPFGLVQSEEQMRAFVRGMLSRHTQGSTRFWSAGAGRSTSNASGGSGSACG